MRLNGSQLTAYLRTLLILGRVSNLPTVWSNCLAGWLLGGAGDLDTFLVLVVGATLLYLAGMFLNDALDVQFDRQYRPERPIPSGAIREGAVWQWGLSFLVLGLFLLSSLGKMTMVFTLLLSASLLIYDLVHKVFALSPLLMAACRLFLLLAAASCASDGVTGLAVWSALALASYVLGLSYLARRENLPNSPRYWPCLFLVVPIALALLVNRGVYHIRGIMLATLLGLWILKSLLHIYWSPQRNVGRSVSGLLAGMVFVDLLSVAGASQPITLIFLGFFGLALLFQRSIPAT